MKLKKISSGKKYLVLTRAEWEELGKQFKKADNQFGPTSEDIDRILSSIKTEDDALKFLANTIMETPQYLYKVLGFTGKDVIASYKRQMQEELIRIEQTAKTSLGKEIIDKIKQTLKNPTHEVVIRTLQGLTSLCRTSEDFKSKVLPIFGLSSSANIVQRLQNYLPLLVQEPVVETDSPGEQQGKNEMMNKALDDFNTGKINKKDLDSKMDQIIREFARALFKLKKTA